MSVWGWALAIAAGIVIGAVALTALGLIVRAIVWAAFEFGEFLDNREYERLVARQNEEQGS